MARLCRVHFVGLGESCARFHPLTLDLRHPKTGAAQESVIWLRNGGGKTTLISLLYSVLIPNQNYFLGRLLGRPTSLADFLRPNELAAMVTEWEFPTLGTPKRIVGQLVQLKDRDLKRRFFSFYAIPEFGFEHIGLLGLGTPARSMDAVLDHLREGERRHGGRMDLVIPGDDQTQWEKHLEERSLDPFLFRLHLKMNKQEGGASDLFKIKSPEDFIRLFLELVFDERTTEELEKSLGLLREKIARSPDREVAVEFGNALLKSLRPFVAEAAQRKQIRDEQSQVWRELAALDVAISNLLKELDKHEASLEKEKSEVGELLKSHDKERVQYTRYRGGYERLGLELRVQETAHALEQAQKTERDAAGRQNLLNAAIAWATLTHKNRELEACVKQLDNLRQEHRPEYESVRRSGAILAAAWDAKINALTENQNEAKADVRNAKKELTRIQGERLQLTKRQGGAESDRDSAKAALNRVDDARRLLRQEELIESNETGKQAQTRWELLAEETKRELSELQRQANELKRDYDDAVREQTEREKTLRARQSECADVQRKLETATNLEKEVATLPAIVVLCEGAAANLRNPHLLTQLDARADAAETRLIELGIANEEDRRSLHYLDHQGLLAPSVDITNLLRRLHDAGVRSALPLYRWLAEHRDIAEAVQLLRANPAMFAGILVQNDPELEIARREVDSFNLKMPVMLVTPESLQRPLAGASTNEHVIVPSEQGLFSPKEAALARPRLEERGQARQGEHDEAAQVRKESAEAAARIRSYLKEWPESRISELKTAAASYAEEMQAITSLIGTEADRIGRIKKQQEANGETQVICASRLGKAQGNAKQLKTFVIEHESQVEKWKSQHEASLKEIENIAEQFRSLESDEPFYSDLEDSAGKRIIKLQEDITLARTSRDKISPEYIGDAPAEEPTTLPEELEPAFYASVTSYEGKVQKGVIDGKIEVLKAAAGELQRAFERVRTDVPQPEIEVAAQRPALQGELAEQSEAVVAARAQLTNAKEKHATAMAQRPDPREFKKGTDTNDALFDRPATSQACEAIVVTISQKLESLGKVLKEGNDNLGTIQSGLSRIVARRPLYKSLHGRVKREQCPGISPHSKFSEDDSSNQTLVDEVSRQFAELEQSLGKVEGSMRKRFDKEMHPLITDERFAKRNIPFRQRLQRLTFEDYAAEGDSHVRAVEDQVKVCQAELDSQEQEKRILVQKLDTLARQAVNLLEQAARVSELPETMGVWARQPFLRINIPKKNDPNERQVLIGQAVDRWFLPGQNIPQGYALAYECLIGLCGAKTINVRILKPEYQLRAVSHDIMDLVTKFSDGEKLTAAIVLYCILVRLRSRLKARAEHLLEGDAGLLLLDNPFGKATLATFVDLQLKMARMMGVQLVYATGINDFSALKHFPHYIRLRNSSRGKATNDYHVTTDSRPLEESITAVTLGFKQNGNRQPK